MPYGSFAQWGDLSAPGCGHGRGTNPIPPLVSITPRWERVEWAPAPVVELMMDGDYDKFQCVKAGRAILGGSDDVVDFPKGWVTDVTSSPLILRPLVPQLGPHAPAALLHDRMLETGRKRSQARKWMWRQLKQLPKVCLGRRYAMFIGVWIWDLFRPHRPENQSPDGALKVEEKFLTHEERLLAHRKARGN